MVYFLYSPDEDTPLQFEFDPAKSAANKEKHGIDFVEAQAIWLDRRFSTMRLRYADEERFEAVAQVDGFCWTAVITMRGESIRVISVRRSRATEVARRGTAEEDHS
jgi:uncharacterized DUF497 family protein